MIKRINLENQPGESAKRGNQENQPRESAKKINQENQPREPTKVTSKHKQPLAQNWAGCRLEFVLDVGQGSDLI